MANNTPVHKIDSGSSSLMWGLIIAIVVIVIAGGVYWYMNNNQDNIFGDLLGNSGSETEVEENPEESVINDPDFENLAEPLSPQEEEDRLSRIANEREALLAERERLAAEAATSQNTETGATTTDSASAEIDAAEAQARAERQREIDAQLLELDNAEEYPPLPDPGA